MKRDGDLTSAVVVYYTTNGTATSGLDYSPLSVPSQFPGRASADFSFATLDDALLEGDESVIITLLTNSAYSVGSPGTGWLLIRDDELVSVSVTADDTARRAATPQFSHLARLRHQRRSDRQPLPSAAPISGSDYVPLDNPVIIPDGDSSRRSI